MKESRINKINALSETFKTTVDAQIDITKAHVFSGYVLHRKREELVLKQRSHGIATVPEVTLVKPKAKQEHELPRSKVIFDTINPLPQE